MCSVTSLSQAQRKSDKGVAFVWNPAGSVQGQVKCKARLEMQIKQVSKANLRELITLAILILF